VKKHISILTFAILFSFGFCRAQKTQPFGKIDTADLKLTDCAFEKGANAEILFDKADITASYDSVVMVRHKRIKIFNDKSTELASIRLPYYSYHHAEDIPQVSVQAQTIQLENNKIIITKIDPKLIYTETTDKNNKALIFTLPEVKAGCVIEYTYKWKTETPANVPTWIFQSDIPALQRG